MIIERNIILQDKIQSSSSDSIYIVTVYNNGISCTCPAGSHHTYCKHMQTVVNKNFDLIKDKADAVFLQKLEKRSEIKAIQEELENKIKKLKKEYPLIDKEIVITNA